ncbi:MAG: PAS domain-containing protein, partial [Actinomycetota bacterium]
MVDLRDGIVRLTDGACAIQGVPPGTSYSVEQGLDMCTEVSRPALAAAFEACTSAGTPFDLELTLTTRSGSVVPVRTIGEAVRGSAGRIVRVQG